jgi:hypothetical protein
MVWHSALAAVVVSTAAVVASAAEAALEVVEVATPVVADMAVEVAAESGA